MAEENRMMFEGNLASWNYFKEGKEIQPFQDPSSPLGKVYASAKEKSKTGSVGLVELTAEIKEAPNKDFLFSELRRVGSETFSYAKKFPYQESLSRSTIDEYISKAAVQNTKASSLVLGLFTRELPSSPLITRIVDSL
jgi:hypothetical protein